MLDIFLNALMILGIIVAVVLSVIIIIIGVYAVVALISKFIDIWNGGKPKSGGQ